MSSEFFDIFSFLIQSGLQFLTSFNIPLTNFTPLAVLFFVAFFSVALRFLLSLLRSPFKIHAPVKKSE